MKRAFRGVLGALLALSGCHRADEAGQPSQVALWAITRPGEAAPRGWIIGTVHALPPETHWRRAAIDGAMAQADRLVLEIGEPVTPATAQDALARLGTTPGLPPPSARLDPAGRTALIAACRRLGLDDARFAGIESWAVALQLSALASQQAGARAEDGVEPQVRTAMAGKPVLGLETVTSQFAAFDGLPPHAQDVLLTDVAREANTSTDSDQDLVALWLRGDDLGLSRQANAGFLSDPVLHEALLTARNRAWTAQLDAMLRAGAHPFVAVGAAHVAGHDGLPVMLRARGWSLRRVY